MPRIGSLFTGYGGLDLAAAAALGGRVAWHCDNDPAASKLLAHRWPAVPNLGDITQVDWADVQPVDVLTGGSPCQDLSHAGKRGGMTGGTRSNLWVAMREAIGALRPGLVVWENVRGAHSANAHSEVERESGLLGGGPDRPVLRALGRVLGDLSGLGYDARWCGVRAADAGAPHGRYRVFVIAHPHSQRLEGAEPAGRRHLPARRAEAVTDPGSETQQLRTGLREGRPRGLRRGRPDHDNPPSPAADTDSDGPQSVRRVDPVRRAPHRRGGPDIAWGVYEPAIRQWEHVTGRPAPAPTEPGRTRPPPLSPAFVEWMQGLPPGHVTDPAIGIPRNEQLKLLGNGVVPQQAALALQLLAVTPDHLKQPQPLEATA